jgi:signal transduction histidine kinase
VPLGGLESAVARALRDPTLRLAFPAPGGTGLVDPDGRPIELRSDRASTRLERDGELLAIIEYDPVVDREDPGLVAAAAQVARLALDNERLSAQVRAQLEEVRASRQRIVAAADAERRRVERDLHDGAQQRLVALSMRLELARETATGAGTLIDETTAELATTIAEVRGVARGLHPPILTEAGLRAAVESLAERAPIPIDIEIPDARYPASVEATAYHVIAEVLAGIGRRPGAIGARVVVHADEHELRIRIEDEGDAGEAGGDQSSRVRNLLDRVAAVGGSLSVERAPTGTRVDAVVPV